MPGLFTRYKIEADRDAGTMGYSLESFTGDS